MAQALRLNFGCPREDREDEPGDNPWVRNSRHPCARPLYRPALRRYRPFTRSYTEIWLIDPKRLVVERWHAQRRPQLFVEFPQILQMRCQSRDFLPIIGQQEFLVARVPQPRELPLHHDRGHHGHLVKTVGSFAKLRVASIFRNAHDAARATHLEAQRRQPFNCLRSKPFIDISISS